ncbi:uncharacterized protein LOC143187453 [Calliopsis andreniformis]|uniref:uncharacterized protein LOC143187453 n=1 Tax=Calliopsis andreniformis TaxID=337506 RepID=UPI003FCDA2A7
MQSLNSVNPTPFELCFLVTPSFLQRPMRCTLNLKQHNLTIKFIREKVLNHYKQQFIQSTIELKVFAQDRKRTQTFCAVNTKECISFGYRKRCLLVLEFVSMQRGQISSITVWDTSTREAAYRTPQPRKQPIGHLNQGSSLFGHLNRGSSHRTTDHLGATHRSITEASNIATVPEHISLRINSIDLDFVCYINCRCNMANTQESVQLKSLRRQRASIKGQLTRIETYLKEGEHVEVHDLQIRKERVVELGKSFEEVQLGIELEDEVSNHDIEREQFERNYFKIVSTINRQLEGLRPSNAATSSVRKADSPNTVMIKQENTLLPKIEIKPYDGNPIEWHSFHDTFKTLVHDNLDIPSVQKFHLLKNALRGEIASVVSALNASEPNYLVAWDLLQKRCNKPRQIVQSHLKVLFELPEVMRDAPANLRSLAEQAQMHVKALATLGLPTGQWDAILVYMIGKKLDKITRRGWERTLENEDMPTFEQLLNFINKQARGEEIEIEVLSSHRRNVYQERSQRNNVGSRGHSYVATANSNKCVMCEGNHEIYQCNQFLKAAVRDRLEVIRRSRLCINCFRSNHVVKNCQATGCRKCKQKHNTLLHFNNENRVNLNNNSTQAVDQAGNSGSNANALTVTCGSEVLLGTAQIKILDRFNKEHDCRVLLDGGSQTHFITEELAEKLQLQKQAVNLTFSGLGQQATKAQYLVKTVVKARHSSFTSQVSFITLPFLTGLLPSRQVDRSNMQVPRNIKLADPEFHKPGKIDALLGNTLFFKLLSIGQIRLSNSAVILQKTLLGWIVTGESNIQPKYRTPTLVNSFHIATSLDKTLNKFWEVESFVDKQFLSAEERAAEELFKQSTVRDTDGRYCVRLPFNERKQLLGNSREVALKRFYALERKLHLNKGLLDSYSEFLKEYEQLGHMTQVSVKETSKGFYLPHHAVVKESSETTKVRVVFDASAKSSTGVSLNETLLIGPNLQDTLYKLLLRFRSYSYVLTADIEKMFRQVKVHAEDRSYQRILWRNSQDQPVKTYELNTVTYGTASAPFLAVRCLQQLANDEQNKFPRAAAIFKRDFYMDDLLTGAATRDLALKIRDEAIALARVGGFNLRQWTSNDAELIKDLDTSNHERTLSLDIDETRKALGICWKPRIDEILYTIKSSENNSRSTKRTILSQIAQLFDPLGLLGPVIVRAKIIMQELWKANINWDDSVPQAILTMWLEFRKELPHLNKFSIPRKTVIDDPVTVQLHGFADASEAAYGACIYLRSVNKQGSCKVSLLCAKSRVAPVKSISLPRLELCAAKLLANLLKESRSALSHIRVERTVLCYSHKHPIVLPRRHYITELIIREEHLKNWHAGIQATLNAVRHKYWPIDGKNFTRKIIHRCINCFKANPKVPEYIMGNLPRDRVTQARPFENAATHLELVTDLTTETCIAAIKRFFARRGKSRNLYSDNGSNFVGARNEIIEIQAFVNWSFSPPRSPHFGGLWEAAVKSFKKHLRATIGETVFTYEQFNSIIIEIEAILNSRPLTPLSSDPNDCIALTPAHFLIGGSLQTLPEYEISDIRNNRLSLWQHTQKIKQHFWNRWHREYLHELHTRSKWHVDANNNIKEGMLVLIREDNLAPLQWKLGRIMELHPGEDKIIRVVSVRTPLGIYKRSVKKLAPLPIEYM